MLLRQKDAENPWEPIAYIHRGRLSASQAVDTSGRPIGAKLSIHLGRTKTDQTGSEDISKSHIYDEDPQSLSAAAAISYMLDGDPTVGDATSTLLFQDPHTGRAMTHEAAKVALRHHLTATGYKDTALALHSLRIGGATA